MSRSVALSFKISADTLEAIRKRAQANYRTIGKELNYLIDKAIQSEAKKEGGKNE